MKLRFFYMLNQAKSSEEKSVTISDQFCFSTVSQYIDAAKNRSGIRYNRQLAKKFGLTENYISDWYTGRHFPSDAWMIALAQMAGLDTALALLHVGLWRAKNGESFSEIDAWKMALVAYRDKVESLESLENLTNRRD